MKDTVKNYISVNAKYYTSERINKIAHHNNRLSKISYLLNKGEEVGENIDIIYSRNGVKHEIKTLNPVERMNTLKEEFKQQEADKLAIQKNKGYHPPKGAKNKENTIVEMVVALSEEQAKEYIKSGVDISLGFDKFAQNIKAVYGFEPLSVSIHLDEGYKDTNGDIKHNIHAHLVLHNFDFKTGKTILRKLKKSAFSDMQDLAEKSFQEVGMNFSRGKSKTVTNKKHLERNEYVMQQQTLQIQELSKAIDVKQENLRDTNSDLFLLSKSINQLQTQKEFLESEYKELTIRLQNTKETVKKQEIEAENMAKLKTELRGYIKKYLLDNTEKTKDSKYIIKNIQSMYSELVELAEGFSNVEYKIQEVAQLKEQNNLLSSQISKLSNTIQTYQDDLETLKKQNLAIDTKLKIELEKKYKLEDINYAFNSFITDENLTDKFKSYINKHSTHEAQEIQR